MDKESVFDFKVVDDSSKFTRAGLSNLILFIGFCFCLIGYQAINEIFHSYIYNFISVLVIGGLFIYYYSRSVSRIIINNEKFTIIRALDTIEIEYKDIKSISLHVIPSSVTAHFFIKFKNTFFPSMFYFVSLSTNFGDFTVSVQKLREKFLEMSDQQ